MALPEHDAAIGRLAAARLRAASAGVRLDAHPDAETWAAYADGGLGPDEVAALEAHLAACASCRLVMSALAPEAEEAPALEMADAPGPARVLPFRPRVTWAWMSIAAGLLGAVTIWSVMRLQQPEMASTMAERTMPVPASAPAGAPIATPPADAKAVPAAPSADAIRRSEPASAVVPAADAPATALRGGAPARADELDRAKTGLDKSLATSDARDRAAFAEARPNASPVPPPPAPAAKLEAASDGAAAGAVASNEGVPVTQAPQAAVASRTAATPGVHGPAVNTQQQNQQVMNAQAQREEAQARAAQAAARAQDQDKERAAAPAEAPRQASVRPSTPAAPAPAAREPQAVGEVAEIVSAAPPAAARTGSRAQGVGVAKRDVSASRDRSDLALADASAAIGFAEPGGRLRWRLIGGSRIESSSDGGATWTQRYEATEQLRAGSAPAIEAAWVVGDRGLVLRLAVPGSWAPVTRPVPVTLVAVTASSADAARVTAEDGRVFETSDGGRSWQPVTGAPR